MDERQLRGFLAILEQGSVSKAAKYLGQAQPSVSQMLLRLEDELGSKLFERTSRGVVPTPAGALFREPATRIVAEFTRARDELSGQRLLQAKQTRIGMPPMIAALFGPLLLSKIAQTIPLQSIAFREGTSDDIKRWIEDEVIDFGLLYNVEGLRNALVRPIFGEEMMLIGCRDHAVAVDQLGIAEEVVDLGACDPPALILTERHNGMRRFIEDACRRENIDIVSTYTVNSFEIVKAMLMMGQGHAILPHAFLVNEISSEKLMARRISRPNFERVVFVVRNLPTASTAFSLDVEATIISAMMGMIKDKHWFARPINYTGI